jgi:hypothetical protein
MRQASRRLTDLLAAWRDANPEQRARLAASIVSEIQVTDGRISAIRPRSARVAYFEELLHDGAGDECWAHARPRMVWHPTCSDGVGFCYDSGSLAPTRNHLEGNRSLVPSQPRGQS